MPLAPVGSSVLPVCNHATVARRTRSAMSLASGALSAHTFSMGTAGVHFKCIEQAGEVEVEMEVAGCAQSRDGGVVMPR